MIGQVLQGNAPWSLRLHELTDWFTERVVPYGIIYITFSRKADYGNADEIRNDAFWAGIITAVGTGRGPINVRGQSLSWLLGTANETGALAGPLTDDMFQIDGSTEITEEDMQRVLGNVIDEETTTPKEAIDILFAAANLPSDFPLRLGTQNWEPGSILLTEVPNWYTLMQGLNAVCGVASPSGAWYVKPDGEIVIGTGNRIFKTPPNAYLLSSEADILSSTWTRSYQAEALEVVVDATRTIGRALLVSDNVVAGVDTTDDAWSLGGINSAIPRIRSAVLSVGGALSIEDSKLLAKRILLARARMEIGIEAQFPAYSKIVTDVKPGDVVGVIETKANWPTQANPESWVVYVSGHAEHPYPAVVTAMSFPIVRGLGIYYAKPGEDSFIDLTDFMVWEDEAQGNNSKTLIAAGDAVTTLYETLLHTASFVDHPTATFSGSQWEWR